MSTTPPEPPPADAIVETEDDRLDEALEESFPASDPPAPFHHPE